MLNLFSVIGMMPQGQDGGGGGLISMLIMFGLVILVMYFLMIRPQQKRQKEHQAMIESVRSGDQIITNAGIHGRVTSTSDKTIDIQIADNVKITIEKSAIAQKK